jgi:hypothetical protein
MARMVAIACAVLAGLGAALFLTFGPTVVVNGHPRSCPGVIVATEAGIGVPHGGACDRARTRWTWYAAGLGLVALTAGTGAMFARREDAFPESIVGGSPLGNMSQ